jgi:hypothetical protein
MTQKNTQDLQLVQEAYHSLPHHHSQWIIWLLLVVGREQNCSVVEVREDF